MTAQRTWARALSYTHSAAGKTLPGMLDELASAQPALLSRVYDGVNGTVDYTLSYHGLAQRVNRYARWGLARGLRKGDVVGLLMANCIDYPLIWLALTRIGCTVALLNTNLQRDAIIQCLKTAGANCLIAGEWTDLGGRPPVQAAWNWSVSVDETKQYESGPLDLPMPEPDDHALLIYTSGTTGLPKATNITHRRIIEWSFWFAGMMDTQPSDRLYNCLPMYHSIGGVVAIGAMLVKGGSVVIRERFSVSQFWDDVVDYKCTIFQYIGELCRYLTQSPTHPRERQHQLRLACGNGLQGTVWLAFQDRFDIPQILEFYAATEGSLSLYNVEGKPGAIGRIPPFLAGRFKIIRYDHDTASPVRTADGFCVPCEVDEPGEAISQIGNGRQFDGYTDRAASRQKVLHNVFAAGDQWFRSGDLMRHDAQGYWYFVDRLGDTFRWKGENVSTSEVAGVLCDIEGVTDAVVFGVVIPGHEGRAGMAAICIDTRFNFASFARTLHAQLPAYAHPVLVRICDTLPMTGTFKLNKTELAREGYNVTDPLWQRLATGQYVPLTSLITSL